jgi:cytochrome c
VRVLLALPALCLLATGAAAADAKAGKAFFTEQCMVCHSAVPGDEGGAQGPTLYGLIGRASAGDKTFGYTKAMKNAHVVWDAATLDRFLTNPPALVRGTAMVAIVADKKDRDNLIAYFQSLPKAP